MNNPLDRILACERLTDGQTSCHGIFIANSDVNRTSVKVSLQQSYLLLDINIY